MPIPNTLVSYFLRLLVLVHLACLWLLYKTRQPLNPSSASWVGLALKLAAVLIGTLLLIDWFSRKDPSRRFAKLIDSVIGVVWIIAMVELVVYSLGLGTP